MSLALDATQTSDLLINLLAGGMIFLLEIVLILWLLPIAIDFRNRRKWRPARQHFITSLIDAQQSLVDRLGTRARRFQEATEPFDPNVDTVWIAKTLPPLFFELIPELRTLTEKAVQQLDLYGPALTPDIHREFIRWHAALVGFTNGLENDGVTASHKVRNPGGGEKFPAELAGRLEARFKALDEATEALLKTARVDRKFVREGGLKVSLLPRDNLHAGEWRGVGGAVETAMISQRKRMKNP